MKKAVLAALGILTVTCTGTMPLGSFAAETEITDSAMEEEGTAEELETGSENETGSEKDNQEAEEDTEDSDREEEGERAEKEEPVSDAETDSVFVLMALPREDVPSVYENHYPESEDMMICPVLISRDDLEELGGTGEGEIYSWTYAEEEPELYLTASFTDGTLVLASEESADTEDGESRNEEADDLAEETDFAEESKDSTSASSVKKKSSASSSKKSRAKSSSGKTGKSPAGKSSDSSKGKTSAKTKASASSKKSSGSSGGKHRSASSAAEEKIDSYDASSRSNIVEEESVKHRPSGKKDATESIKESSERDSSETDSAEDNSEDAGDTGDGDDLTADKFPLPAAAGTGGLLAAAVFALFRRRK